MEGAGMYSRGRQGGGHQEEYPRETRETVRTGSIMAVDDLHYMHEICRRGRLETIYQ